MRRVADAWLAMVLLVVLGACGLPALAEPDAQDAREEAVTSLLDADRAWARTTTAKDFMSFLADDAIYMPFHRGRVMDGKKEWGPWLDSAFARAELAVDWEAVRAVVGPSADMGYTTGDWRATWKDAEGKPVEFVGSYLTVWERRDDGTWKAIAQTEDAGTSVWAARHSAPE